MVAEEHPITPGKMKTGTTFHIDLFDLVKPLENRVIDVTLDGGEQVHGRIVAVYRTSAEVKVIPGDVRE